MPEKSLGPTTGIICETYSSVFRQFQLSGDSYFSLLRVAADLGAKSVKHQDKQTTLQN
jgi:hypothetical protein